MLVAGSPERGTDTPARDRPLAAAAARRTSPAAAAIAGCPVAVRRAGRRRPDRPAAGGRPGRAGVDVRVQRGGRTGTVVVLVEPGGERTMLPDRGAAQQLATRRPALARRRGVAARAGLLVVRRADRHERARADRHVPDARRLASASTSRRWPSCGRSAPAASPSCSAVWQPDVVFANAAEAALVGAVGAALLVVKDGARPVVLRRADGPRGAGPGRADVDGVVDTTGAGDAFAGGFLAAVLDGAGPVGGGRAGCLARRTLGDRRPGRRLGMIGPHGTGHRPRPSSPSTSAGCSSP